VLPGVLELLRARTVVVWPEGLVVPGEYRVAIVVGLGPRTAQVFWW
jgi:hypothetical protein